MARYLLASGSLVALMGAALIPPVLVARTESGWQSTLAVGIVTVGCALIACGMTALGLGLWQTLASSDFHEPNRVVKPRLGSGMPSGVRAAVAANVIILMFLAFD